MNTLHLNPFVASSFVWPLCFLLGFLIMVHQLRQDLQPIFKGVIGGLAVQSSQNAIVWAMGIGIAIQASMTSLIEVADQMGWPLLHAAAKILAPGIAAMMGFAMKGFLQDSPKTPTVIDKKPDASQVIAIPQPPTNP